MERLARCLTGRVALDVEARDWEEAVRLAGEVLEKAGDIEPAYTEAMIRTVREIGPYIVVTPGVALPHARPENGVLRAAIGLVRLARPVSFGNEVNDPVDLVFPFGTPDRDQHIEVLAALSRLLSDPRRVAALRRAATEEDILAVLRGAPLAPAGS
ncbi:MAG TPA: PTS maltose transporter subunit IIBC [Clostridiales bacterium]|nr:PTS maltose transporter subunit IIBC [Clostridiales bacterium]